MTPRPGASLSEEIPRGQAPMRIPAPPEPAEIKKIREALQLSQAQMAHLLNTPKKTYQNWEQGLRAPMGTVALVFKLLNKKPDLVRELLTV